MAGKLKVGGGEIVLLKLEDIQFDESYQRGVKSSHKGYVKEFDDAAVGVPTVARRPDGSLWGVDARQRITAMIKLGIDRWRCYVIPSSGARYEAQLFKKINKDRTAVSSAELFGAACTAEDPSALATKRAVESAGLRIYGTSGGVSKEGDYSKRVITCHSTVWRSVQTYGEENVARALRLIVSTWPGNKEAIGAYVVAAMCHLIGSQGDKVEDDRFVSVVGRKRVQEYIQYGTLDMSSKHRGILKAIIQQYNKRLGKPAQLVALYQEETPKDKEVS